MMGVSYYTLNQQAHAKTLLSTESYLTVDIFLLDTMLSPVVNDHIGGVFAGIRKVCI